MPATSALKRPSQGMETMNNSATQCELLYVRTANKLESNRQQNVRLIESLPIEVKISPHAEDQLDLPTNSEVNN